MGDVFLQDLCTGPKVLCPKRQWPTASWRSVRARVSAEPAACPACATVPGPVRSRHVRRLAATSQCVPPVPPRRGTDGWAAEPGRPGAPTRPEAHVRRSEADPPHRADRASRCRPSPAAPAPATAVEPAGLALSGQLPSSAMERGPRSAAVWASARRAGPSAADRHVRAQCMVGASRTGRKTMPGGRL